MQNTKLLFVQTFDYMWRSTRLYVGARLYFYNQIKQNHICLPNSIIDPEAAVNSKLENLRKWLIANKLSFNVAKTEFMLNGSKRVINKISDSQPNAFIDNKKIGQVYMNYVKLLGAVHMSRANRIDSILSPLMGA